jgi:SagB-type dehydrogenase family enzyme
MKKTCFIIIAACISLAVLTAFTMITNPENGEKGGMFPNPSTVIELPEPRLESSVSVEQTLLGRRSVRSFSNRPVSLEELSQLLWAAQGITEPVRGFRTAPSAGATFPFEVYVVAGRVTGLDAGIYKYDYRHHRLHLLREGDFRSDLAGSALGQSSITDGAVNIVLTAIYERTTQRYGDRGVRYVHMEAGHIAQNVFLQAVALDLGSVPIGAFSDENVGEMLGIPENENTLYILPVGKL